MIKNNLITLSLLLIISFSTKAQENNIINGEIILMLNQKEEVSSFLQNLNKANKNIKVNIKQCISKRLNTWLIKDYESILSNQDFLNIIQHRPEVTLSQFNHNNVSKRDTCPDDTFFASNQWSLNNTSQNGGTFGVDIDACKAWDLAPIDTLPDTTFFGDKIVVAVIDDGFDLNHNDLSYYTNVNEIPGDNIDNDNNGYIDDIKGWNAYTDTGFITSNSHGTHVAGVIGAKGNNSFGVSGVNWGVSILPIQGSSNIESVVLAAYGYALEMRAQYDSSNGTKGAFIVATNSSFGINFGDPANFPLWCAFYDSLGARGILNCAATANSNVNVDLQGDMPTKCTSDWLISVTNTTATDIKYNAGFGSTSIDIGAPGTGIYSTLPNNNYGQRTGTSQSTPHVTGAVAFVYAVACSNFMQTYKIDPANTSLLVKDAILNKADPNQSLNGITVSGGRLNLYNTANEIKNFGLCGITSIKDNTNKISKTSIYPNPNNGNFTLKINDADEYNIQLYSSLGQLVYMENIDFTSNLSKEIALNSRLNKGIYFLKLASTKNNNSEIIKFVIE